tara:strand:- start:331 stop:495 length:165 start_codon:yes stop_codon:yes gene_type:complete
MVTNITGPRSGAAIFININALPQTAARRISVIQSLICIEIKRSLPKEASAVKKL